MSYVVGLGVSYECKVGRCGMWYVTLCGICNVIIIKLKKLYVTMIIYNYIYNI